MAKEPVGDFQGNHQSDRYIYYEHIDVSSGFTCNSCDYWPLLCVLVFCEISPRRRSSCLGSKRSDKEGNNRP